jgi:D-inositol-3-phosphate glycosyltransferase
VKPESHRRVAIISLHTSPLAQPGVGDSGGMNVYVREMASALAQQGNECIVYTRADSVDLPREVLVEPGHRVVYIHAGPYHLPKEALTDIVDEFIEAMVADIETRGGVDAVHAHYWLSGEVGHALKHRLEVPFVVTFHTLARIKGAGGDIEPGYREAAEAAQLGCADAVCVSCEAERSELIDHYGVPAGRVVIVSPGVEHAIFGPGDRGGARRAIGEQEETPLVLFAGRIQALKGPDVAIRALALMENRQARLLVVGGASGIAGHAQEEEMRLLAEELGLADRVRFVAPQPHHLLSTYYRAADVIVVPSRSESFGLVALEAAACGTPVVASAVGGLTSLVDDGVTGVLVKSRTPAAFAGALDAVLNDPAMATSMSMAGAVASLDYSWTAAATRLNTVYDELCSTALLECR